MKGRCQCGHAECYHFGGSHLCNKAFCDCVNYIEVEPPALALATPPRATALTRLVMPDSAIGAVVGTSIGAGLGVLACAILSWLAS